MTEYTISKIIKNGDEYSYQSSGGGSIYRIGYLMVAGGGGGGYEGQRTQGGGGGGGEVCYGGLTTSSIELSITVGTGGTGGRYYVYPSNGGNSSISDGVIICNAIGGFAPSADMDNYGGMSGHGWKGGYCFCGVSPDSICVRSFAGGGGGSNAEGKTGVYCFDGSYPWGKCANGGLGCNGMGGGGGGYIYSGRCLIPSCGCCGGGNGGYRSSCSGTHESGFDATNYGGGGGGGGGGGTSCKGGNGYQGVVDICYKPGCSGFTTATGGNCCYECDGYCVHRFTSNGTFTITG